MDRDGSTNGNRLLAGLPPYEYADLLPRLQRVPLTRGERLHEQGWPLSHVYFPGGGLCSVSRTMQDGRTVVVGMIGRDGVVVPSMLAGNLHVTGILVHVGCDGAMRMPLDAFHTEMARGGVFFDRVRRAAGELVGSIVQTAACNGLHTVSERLARWLLLARDHLGSSEIPLTHDQLGMMLGVRRATITLAVQSLRESGCIGGPRYGRICIFEPMALQAVACECYEAQKILSERVPSTLANPYVWPFPTGGGSSWAH